MCNVSSLVYVAVSWVGLSSPHSSLLSLLIQNGLSSPSVRLSSLYSWLSSSKTGFQVCFTYKGLSSPNYWPSSQYVIHEGMFDVIKFSVICQKISYIIVSVGFLMFLPGSIKLMLSYLCFSLHKMLLFIFYFCYDNLKSTTDLTRESKTCLDR